MKKITFHQEVTTPENVTDKLPLSVLHNTIQMEIKKQDQDFPESKWLQPSYKVFISLSYIFLYTESGHRIDIWL